MFVVSEPMRKKWLFLLELVILAFLVIDGTRHGLSISTLFKKTLK